jgi:hypothetical protein
MTVIDVQLIGAEEDTVAWPDLALDERYVIYVTDAWQLAGIETGTVNGQPSVALRLDAELDLDDLVEGADEATKHVAVIAETTLRSWIAATCALRGRFPEAFAGTPLEGN